MSRPTMLAALAVALQFSLSAGAMAAGAALDLGLATASGAPSVSFLTGRNGGYEQAINLASAHVTSNGNTVGFSVDVSLKDDYMSGWWSSYGISGQVGAINGLNLLAKDGYALQPGSFGYRITGEVSVTDQAWVTLSTGQTYRGAGVRSQPTVYQFSVTSAGGGSSALSWYGNNPYYQGPNGSASVNSAATITIKNIEYFGTVAPIPEPGTWALMGLGVLVVAAARRRAHVNC